MKGKENILEPLTLDLFYQDGKIVSVKANEEKAQDKNSAKTGLYLISTPKLPKIY